MGPRARPGPLHADGGPARRAPAPQARPREAPRGHGQRLRLPLPVRMSSKREELQREIVANVSHQFRTPVAAIRGLAETLESMEKGGSRVRRKFLRGILRHAD